MRCSYLNGLLAVAAAMGLMITSTHASEVDLDNFVVAGGGNGHLKVTVGDMGGYGHWNTIWDDVFNPSPDPDAGELPEEFAMFSRILFLFVDPSDGQGGGTHRGIATVHPDAIDTYPPEDSQIICTVTTPNSDPHTPGGQPCVLGESCHTESEFDCTGNGIDLSFTLSQFVDVLPDGENGEKRALLEQEYTVTNNLGQIPLTLVQHLDEDMPWGSGNPIHTDDLVGADFAELDRFQVYAQDEQLTTAALVLRTKNDVSLDPMVTTNPDTGAVDHNYYAGKQNLSAPPGNSDYPGGDCPEQDFGTDFQIWDNRGVPNCWKNYVPTVGYNIAGITAEVLGDTFIGYHTRISIGNGESFTITYETLYGFRPEPTLVIPPRITTQTIELGDDGCGLFLWSLKNVNPIVGEKDPVPVEEFYIDVEAGDGAVTCSDMTAPDGWTLEVCQVGVDDGHTLYKFTGGTPIQTGSSVHGRYRVETNGTDESNNNNIIIPPLSVVMHAAQAQEEALCDFNFGPTTNGDWSIRSIATAFLPVPTLSSWAKITLSALVIGAGALLVLRSRRPVVG